MDNISMNGLGAALIRGGTQYVKSKEEHEDKMRRLAQEDEDRAFTREGRRRQKQAWMDQDASVAATFDEAWGVSEDAARFEPPPATADLLSAFELDKDGDGLEDLPPVAIPGAPQPAPVGPGGMALSVGPKGAVAAPSRVARAAASSGGAPVEQVVGKPGQGMKTMVGGGPMSSVLEARMQGIMAKYAPARGRVERMRKDYEADLQAAGSDPDKLRSAKIRFAQRWQGIKPTFDKLDAEYENTLEGLAAVRMTKQQNVFFNAMNGIPVDPRKRAPYLEELFAKYGDELKSLGMTKERLQNAKYDDNDITIGSGKDAITVKGIRTIDTGDGQPIPVGAHAMVAAGMMDYQTLFKVYTDSTLQKQQTKLAISQHQENVKLQKAQIAAASRANGGGRAMTAEDRFERDQVIRDNAMQVFKDQKLIKPDGSIDWEANAKLGETRAAENTDIYRQWQRAEERIQGSKVSRNRVLNETAYDRLEADKKSKAFNIMKSIYLMETNAGKNKKSGRVDPKMREQEMNRLKDMLGVPLEEARRIYESQKPQLGDQVDPAGNFPNEA